MEKLAEGLERLGEDDLLHVVQLVHDNKTEETYTKNDVESEFHSDAVATSVLTRAFQMASSTSTSIPYPISSSRCSGTLSTRKSTSQNSDHFHSRLGLCICFDTSRASTPIEDRRLLNRTIYSSQDPLSGMDTEV